MFHSVSLFSQAPLARGSRVLPSVLLFQVESEQDFMPLKFRIYFMSNLFVLKTSIFEAHAGVVNLLGLLGLDSTRAR